MVFVPRLAQAAKDMIGRFQECVKQRAGEDKIMRYVDLLDTHTMYEIYYDRQSHVSSRTSKYDIYGDPQVHVSGVNTERLPQKVIKMEKPWGKKPNISIWYWLPERRIEGILNVFHIAGYNVVDTRIVKDVFGHSSTMYSVAKRR